MTTTIDLSEITEYTNPYNVPSVDEIAEQPVPRLNPSMRFFTPSSKFFTPSNKSEFESQDFSPPYYTPRNILKLDLSKIGAIDNKDAEILLTRDELKKVMELANLLHRPTEEMDVESVIYFEEKKEQTLLHYKDVLKAHTDELAEAARLSELAWQDMYNEITNAEEKEQTKMTSEQKEKICNLVLKLTYEIEKEKIDLRYPALKPTE